MTPTSGSGKFDELRDALAAEPALRAELERALQTNVDRVNPTDRGNRFVVGGTVEWIIAAAACAADVLTIPGGHGVDGYDLLDLERAAKGLWSVKSQSSRNPGDFRISNGLGGSGQGLLEPTIFLSPHLPGLVFVHPSTHPHISKSIRPTKDATVLPHHVVREHAAAHPECVAQLRVPQNEGRGTENLYLEYTKTILVPSQFPRLSAMFLRAEPVAGTIADVLRDLAAMHASGVLTDEEFQAAKDQALGRKVADS